MYFDSVFLRNLRKQSDELFIKNGKIYRTIDMQGRGSDVDEYVGEINDPKFERQMLAYRLLKVLEPLCPATGRSHRMRIVPEHEACVDCNLGRQ